VGLNITLKMEVIYYMGLTIEDLREALSLYKTKILNTFLQKSNVGIVVESDLTNFSIKPSNTWTKLINDTTITQSGEYSIHASINLAGVGNSTRLAVRMNKNGSLIIMHEMPISQAYTSTSLNIPMVLDANDMISLEIYSKTVVSANTGNMAKFKMIRIK
jgi:hypothetical protein